MLHSLLTSHDTPSQPTALAPLVGIIGGITEHTAYFSMAIHSLTAALSCPLAAFLIRSVMELALDTYGLVLELALDTCGSVLELALDTYRSVLELALDTYGSDTYVLVLEQLGISS